MRISNNKAPKFLEEITETFRLETLVIIDPLLYTPIAKARSNL